MSAAHPASGPADPHQQLYLRLVARDPTAPNDLAETFLEPLIDWLTEHNRPIQSDFIHEAAEESILALIHHPPSYRPQASSLETYLRMSAQGDLRNLLHRETRHRVRLAPLDSVELSDQDGKYTGREDDPALDLMIEEELAELAQRVPGSVRDGLTAVEARVLELLLRRERRTAVYAEACGFTDRPVEEQRHLVKQIKDRLTKRIERQGGP